MTQAFSIWVGEACVPPASCTVDSQQPGGKALSKYDMVKKVKTHLVNLLDGLEIPPQGSTQHCILPWTTLPRILSEHGWELENWPSVIPLPGSGGLHDENKGINGLSKKHLFLLYEAVESKDHPLRLRQIVNA